MMVQLKVLTLAALVTVSFLSAPSSTGAREGEAPAGDATKVRSILLVQRQSCQTVSTCQEAVEMWCGGYRRADGDNDGIPCENVCRSKAQVDKIRQEIGC